MENASKALIIAGSILLSILIIALGMYIFSQSSGVTDDTTLSQMEAQTFNSKFDRYKGRQNGSNVEDLISTIINNVNGKAKPAEVPNVQFWDNGASSASQSVTANSIIGSVAGTTGANTIKTTLKNMKELVESSHVYYVYIATNNDTDLVHGIIICYSQSQGTQAAAEALAATN